MDRFCFCYIHIHFVLFCIQVFGHANLNKIMQNRNKIDDMVLKLYVYEQILGLTASPGTNRAKDKIGAKDHLLRLMANLDVSELSVVRECESSLLQFSSKPERGQFSNSSIHLNSFFLQDLHTNISY